MSHSKTYSQLTNVENIDGSTTWVGIPINANECVEFRYAACTQDKNDFATILYTIVESVRKYFSIERGRNLQVVFRKDFVAIVDIDFPAAWLAKFDRIEFDRVSQSTIFKTIVDKSRIAYYMDATGQIASNDTL